jgi:hypothetical protein
MDKHEAHCFIAIPYSRDDAEHKRIEGWIDEVIRPPVKSLGLEAEIAALKNAPSAITLEIRTHLAFDKLAIVDLGGATGDDPPNPNVMYELGIRHAFDLPTVVLAWDTQVLPFDIGEHRIVRKERHAGTFKWHRDTILEFAQAALADEFFRPMNAVRQAMVLEAAAGDSKDGALVAIVDQLKDLRHAIAAIEARLPEPDSGSISALRRAILNRKSPNDVDGLTPYQKLAILTGSNEDE